MHHKIITTPPSAAEVTSFRRSFGGWPWFETISHTAALDYLAGFRQLGFVWSFHDNLQRPAYLYLHGRVYDDLTQLVTDEFVGPDAFYVARDRRLIEQALADCGRVCFISNLHADKTLSISASYKPRLKLLPGLINELLQAYGTVAYFTHPLTAVHRYNAKHLAMANYDVKRTIYDVQPRPEANGIDQLVLFTISQKRSG